MRPSPDRQRIVKGSPSGSLEPAADKLIPAPSLPEAGPSMRATGGRFSLPSGPSLSDVHVSTNPVLNRTKPVLNENEARRRWATIERHDMGRIRGPGRIDYPVAARSVLRPNESSA